eukprot:TRINITY_DN1332_c0_g1_i1.p1 TRINITY_DN1332_c0_g1~~TRINITY_DN1332_c0_g1_i1.p1  ORF type:complete len:157 (-),score=40.46 TRINITY_DN1332_c0_g1_i1:180-650(-)
MYSLLFVFHVRSFDVVDKPVLQECDLFISDRSSIESSDSGNQVIMDGFVGSEVISRENLLAVNLLFFEVKENQIHQSLEVSFVSSLVQSINQSEQVLVLFIHVVIANIKRRVPHIRRRNWESHLFLLLRCFFAKENEEKRKKKVFYMFFKLSQYLQ